jgi:hypothetical protein
MAVAKDGHMQMFNLDLSGVPKILNPSNFWRFTYNCPVYHMDTYHVSMYDVTTNLEWGYSHHNNKHIRNMV